MSDIEGDEPVFFPQAILKLKERFSCDELNFFDPSSDFTEDVADIHLLDQLAKGSYGIVYNAAIGSDKYAVKVEDLRTGVEEQLNILSELTVLQSLPHEYLVKFFGAGYLSKSAIEAKVVIVMELCERGALRERISEGLPWSLLVRLALDTARGLAFLHENHIVHRDIKTTNVLVDRDWRAKICDFSFSCHSHSHVKNEYIYGTDEFMSPEISMGEEFDESSDIFSFGIILCEMVTQREPSATFLKRHAHQGCFALPEDELKEAVLLECPESLVALALQCCNIDPTERPSAADCVEWLQSLLDDMRRSREGETFDATATPSALVSSSPVREGTVIYPKTIGCKSSSRPFSLERGISATLTSDMNTRLSYLEIQVQELRAENKVLSREILRLSEQNKEPFSQSEPFSLNSSFFRPQPPQTPTSQISAPSLPSPPRPTSIADANAPRLGDVLSQIDVLKRSLLNLSADVVKIRAQDGTMKSYDDGNVEKVSEYSCPSSIKTTPVISEDVIGQQFQQKMQCPELSPSTRKNISRTREVGKSKEKRTSDEESDSSELTPEDGNYEICNCPSPPSNVESVVQSFLGVVEKCSEVTMKSQQALENIDKRNRGVYQEAIREQSMYPGILSNHSLLRRQSTFPKAIAGNNISSVLSQSSLEGGTHKDSGGCFSYNSDERMIDEESTLRIGASNVETPPDAGDTWRTVRSKSPVPPQRMPGQGGLHQARRQGVAAMYDIMETNDTSCDLRRNDKALAVNIRETAQEEQRRAHVAKSFFEADHVHDSVFKKDNHRIERRMAKARSESNPNKYCNDRTIN